MRSLTLAVTVLAALPPSQASAGAWTTPEGKIWAKVAWIYLDSDRLLESKDLSDSVFVPNRPVRAVMYVTPKIILNPFVGRDDALENVGFEFEVLLPVWGRGWPADPIPSRLA